MSKKPIEISKSSLLSLKAELLRKHEEINKSKVQNAYKKVTTQLKKKNIKSNQVEDSNSKNIEGVDNEALQLSKAALERKSKLYEKLSKGEHTEGDEMYLVEFDRKNENNRSTTRDISPPTVTAPEHNDRNTKDDDWVEYVDCLGRSRMIHRDDLSYLKSKDQELSDSLPPEKLHTPVIDPMKTEFDEFNQKREESRKQWEKQEEELVNKKNIHYQDVLFSEARSHGVGYFSFSQNEEERAKQQAELKKLRQETQSKQEQIEKLREMREKQIALRAKAARNRKRARMGLPPEEDEPEMVAEVPEKQEEPQKVEKTVVENKEEKRLDELRKKHIRPWDVGKEGVRHVKSQHEWNEERRKERREEFAPPQQYSTNKKREWRAAPVSHDDEEVDQENNHSLFFTTKRNTSKITLKEKFPEGLSNDATSSKTLNPSELSNDGSKVVNPCTSETIVNPYKRFNVEEDTSNVRSSTKCTWSTSESSSDDEGDSRMQPTSFKPTPIIDELEPPKTEKYDPFEENNDDDNGDDRRDTLKYAEIPPPPTFEYYGPSGAKKSRPNRNATPKTGELTASIQAGLQYLRRQAERKHANTDNVGFFE